MNSDMKGGYEIGKRKKSRIYKENVQRHSDLYSKVKEYFPALVDCYWNGPESDESCRTEFVFYLSKDERNFKHTKPPKNYTHLYEGFGNHICIRKDYYPVVEPIIRDLIEKNELVNWYTRTGEIIDAIKTLTAEKKEGKMQCD